MSFVLGLFFFILGSAAVSLCLCAIPGRGGETAPTGHDAHGHGGH